MRNLIDGSRRELQAVRAGASGSRFRDRFDSRSTPSVGTRIALVVGGVLCIAAGIVMLVIPGPGLVGLLLGTALLAAVFRPFASFFDALERIGVRLWTTLPVSWRASRLVKASFAVAVAGGAIVAALVSYWLAHRFLA